MTNNQECFETINQKKLCLKEMKTQFYIDNDMQLSIVKAKIDNCLIKNGKRCDWLLIIEQRNIEIYIELKGCRIKDALEQLEITLNNTSLKQILEQKYKNNKPSKTFCCIIYTKCPSNQPEIENAKKTFRKLGIILKFISSNSSKRPQKLSQLIS
ncbi:hypothetical protein C7H19_20655 [Aphanothece hegewaldii CCALA 016]|uniref:Uncharacterized protein n=1 Tax=Aphanothece hegewaldii CCALA 016 TaxID=2107694 RepID=A0A2T1LSQ9_9CHRO|nr:hypothetical protein [Aphanothece hegewaldii]PSF33107.1 hypothetical protein C7H19_20655 [Aphanothece hegewaldii CCALA 016]